MAITKKILDYTSPNEGSEGKKEGPKKVEKKISSDSTEMEVSSSDFKSKLVKVKRYIVNLQTISLRDKIFFVQNLRIMIKGGLSLGQALKTISAQITNSLFQKVLIDISKQVESGISFSKSLEKYPKIFDNLFVNMVKSGEVSGNLEDVLEKLHVQMKRDHDLVAKVKGAMIYPAVVVVAMVGIGTAMMIFVIPKLVTVFDEFQADLPLPTRVLIGISKFVTHNGLFVGIILIAFVIVFTKFYKSKQGRQIFHKFFLHMPILAPIVKKINLARFCRTTSSLLKTDISIVQSLEITSMVVGNVYYRSALKDASRKITKGLQINKVLSAHPKLFPATVIQMLKVGEESGSVDTTLDEVALFYEDDVNQVMENLPSIIEPLLILVLGLGVGAMAVAIIMPMYSLTQSI
jgi:type IV pilus assembly protein PilC